MIRTAEDWCDVFGLRFLGNPPRGWCDETAPRWQDPITITDFYRRATRSRLAESYDKHGWLALMDRAHAAEQDGAHAGTHWGIHVIGEWGVLTADGEQVRLPGPITAIGVAPSRNRRLDYLRTREADPHMIQAVPMIEYAFTVTLRPGHQDTYTVFTDARASDGAGVRATPRCPTCGSEAA